jgi:hypothetical protein
VCLAEPNMPVDANAGRVTAWALLGSNPVFGQSEEVRVGYLFGGEGPLSFFEPAFGFMHNDGLDQDGASWAARGYLLAHTLDAEMFSRLLGGIDLPAGDVYGGLYCQYGVRNNDWSAGYVVGGLVAWPSKVWQTVAEYDRSFIGERADTQTVVVGLRHTF